MPIQISWQGATLGANTFTGAQAAPTLALGGATIGTNALAVTGTATFSSKVTASAFENAASQPFFFTGRSAMWSTVDGNIVLTNNGNSDFGRLQFGGILPSFPSIKRSGAALQVRLADDSGWADIAAGNVSGTNSVVAGVYLYYGFSGSVGQSAGTGSPEGVVTAGVGSTRVRTDGGPGTTFYVKESGTGNTGWVAK